MNMKKRKRNSGVSTVVGTVLFMILIFSLASTLFLALSRYNESVQMGEAIEQERAQERISMIALSNETVAGTNYIKGVLVNNTASITSNIRAVYIDDVFLCDPSIETSINPTGTYMNAKSSMMINFTEIEYSPTSTIAVATERGVKVIRFEADLMAGNSLQTVLQPPQSSYGPLRLDFDNFYYKNSTTGGSFNYNQQWYPGWNVPKSWVGNPVVWNITVTNIDPRNITLNQYTALTLVPNENSGQAPWYVEPSEEPNATGPNTIFIASNQTVHIIYTYVTPRESTPNLRAQSIPNADTCKIFLTFYGVFHEDDGTTKPYGQTIPFESVLIGSLTTIPTPTMTISSNTTSVKAGTDYANITITAKNADATPATNQQITFSLSPTSTGTLTSSTTVFTNTNGQAWVIYKPPNSITGNTNQTATITANWQAQSLSSSINVTVTK